MRKQFILGCSSFILYVNLAHAVPFRPELTDSSLSAGEVPLHEASDIAQVNRYHSGDTAFYLCPEGVFQFGVVSGTDTWGYRAPDNTEYAIFGVYEGIAVVNTSTMQVVGVAPGPKDGCGMYRWRDMKSYRHYVYAVSECSGTNEGVMILDMSSLPDSFSYVGSIPVVPSPLYYQSHNMSIDTLKGYMYLEAMDNTANSITFYDLTDPANPTFAGSLADGSIHDLWAWDDTLFVAEGSQGSFSIWNMADKLNPALITRVPIPNAGYVHNIWPNGSMTYCATTEETANKTVKIWDIHDLNNIAMVGEYLGGSHLAHNVHWDGDRLYISHYESGVTIVDVSDPTNPREIGQYDTYSTEGPNFNGCWGAYPFTNSGLIYASNINGTMYVLSQHTSILADTMWVATTYAEAGTQVKVDIYAGNSQPIHQFTIPVSWSGPYDMNLVATDRTGTRTEYFESEAFLGIDLAGSRIAIELRASNSGTSPDLPPGSGKILSLIFDVPGDAAGESNPVTLAPYVYGGGTHLPTFTTACLGYSPDTISGSVILGTPCCTGFRGDANGDSTISVVDLNFLLAYFFLGGTAPACLEEADANGNGSLNVVDLNYLVSYIFLSGPDPADCP